MYDISNLKDLKLVFWIFASEAFTLAQTRVLRYEVPPNRLILLEYIMFVPTTGTETMQISSIRVDDHEMLRTGSAASTTVLAFRQSDHAISAPQSTAHPTMWIPARKTVEITMTNGVIAGTVEVRIWGYMHMDRVKEFLNYATIQGG